MSRSKESSGRAGRGWWARTRDRFQRSLRAARDRRAAAAIAWVADDSEGLRRRKYDSYEQYLALQRSKLDTLQPEWLERYDRRYHAALAERLRQSGAVVPGSTALCLAARVGTEVRSFLDLGCFAVGIDLNPGPNNRYVLVGDFHEIQFPDSSADIVFTNSLDHAFDFDRLITEILRVLRPGGRLILEVVDGEEGEGSSGMYEAAQWRRVEDLLALFTRRGLAIQSQTPFQSPWKGVHVVLSR